MKPFNLEEAKAGKPVQTRDGRPVRIICWNRKHTTTNLVGLLCNQGVHEFTIYYNNDGKAAGPNYLDLVMAPVERTVWVNVVKGSLTGCISTVGYITEEEAKGAAKGYVNLKTLQVAAPITYTE